MNSITQYFQDQNPLNQTGVEVILPPRLEMKGRKVVCNSEELDLGSKWIMPRIFSAFIYAPGQKLTRNQLLEAVYDVDTKGKSERFLDSAYTSLRRQIVRARDLAQAHFSNVVPSHIEWFHFDRRSKDWSLFQIQETYLNQKLNEEMACILLNQAAARKLMG